MQPKTYSDAEMEKSLIGSLILDDASFILASEKVKPEFFGFDDARKLASILWDAREKGVSVSPVTLQSSLTGANSRLVSFMYQCLSVSDFSQVLAQAKNLRDSWINNSISRIQIDYQNDLSKGMLPADAFAKLEAAKAAIDRMDVSAVKHRHVFNVAQDCLKKSIKISEGGGMMGYPTGIQAFDKISRGVIPGELVFIIGRPNMGKTQFALTIKDSLEQQGLPGKFDSIETSSISIIYRDIASMMQLPISYVKEGRLTDIQWEKYRSIVSSMADLETYIDDTPFLYVEDWASDTRRMVAKQGVKWVMIDYHQLFATRMRGTEEQQLGHIATMLKEVAKDCNIPVIVLAQLNRMLNVPFPQYPEITHIRGSGRIEEVADHILGLWRPDYYNIELRPDGGLYPKNYTLLRYLKHRDRDSNTTPEDHEIDMWFDPVTQRFRDLPKEDVFPAPEAKRERRDYWKDDL